MFLIILPQPPPFPSVSLFQPQERFYNSEKPKNMGTCPIRCQSNQTILENPPEPLIPGGFYSRVFKTQMKIRKMCLTKLLFLSAAQDSMIVSLCNYPSFGRTELTMCLGEQLTILSEYVMWLLMFHLHLCFT